MEELEMLKNLERSIIGQLTDCGDVCLSPRQFELELRLIRDRIEYIKQTSEMLARIANKRYADLPNRTTPIAEEIAELINDSIWFQEQHVKELKREMEKLKDADELEPADERFRNYKINCHELAITALQEYETGDALWIVKD